MKYKLKKTNQIFLQHACKTFALLAMYFSAWVGLRSLIKHLVIRHLAPCHQAQAQIKHNVFRLVNAPRVIGPKKNMYYLDSNHKLSNIGLVVC